MLDVPPTIEKIKEVSGVETVAYMGYSTGSTIMFYALSKETEENYLADNISKFIAVAPCMILQGEKDYDSYIATDWQNIKNNVYPNALGENFDAPGYCSASNNSDLCTTLT